MKAKTTARVAMKAERKPARADPKPSPSLAPSSAVAPAPPSPPAAEPTSPQVPLPPPSAFPLRVEEARSAVREGQDDSRVPASPARVVEAALFSAGKPLALDVLAENTRLPREIVKESLKALAAEYDARGGALEIARAGDKWAMQVRAAYAPATARLAPMEIPFKVLKTLALIAYHQPVLQSKLIDMVGAKGYEHIQILHERGLVKRRVADRSFLLSTTETFPEYFGIPATDREAIKKHLATKLGIALPADDGNGNQRLDALPAATAPESSPAGSTKD